VKIENWCIMTTRKSKIKRETKETSVDVSLNIDGSGKTSVSTGISFLSSNNLNLLRLIA